MKLLSVLLAAVFAMQPISSVPVVSQLLGWSPGAVYASAPQQGSSDESIFLPTLTRAGESTDPADPDPTDPDPTDPDPTDPDPTDPTDLPEFAINSPIAGTVIGGMTFFSIQRLDTNPIERVVFRAGDMELGVDDDGSNGFRIFLNPAELPAGPIELSATASGPGGESTRSIEVTIVPNPPQSATIGVEGGVLASEIGSVIAILPGTVPAGTTVSIDELTQQETTDRHGIEWDSMGVTFLGAQDVSSSAPIDGPFGMVASAGFGNRVQPGQAIVNYRIVPDADGDGIDELVVINTASIAPNNDVIADPIDTVQVRSASTPLNSLIDLSSRQSAGLAGPPGTLIDVEIFGLNPQSARGNVAVFQSPGVDPVEVSGLVLPGEEEGLPQTFSVVLPKLPVGPASFVVVNKSTGFESEPIAITVLEPVALDLPATQIIDNYLAESIAYLDSLPRLPSDEDSGMFAVIQQMQEMRSKFQELVAVYPQMEPDEAAQVQQYLDAFAQQIAGSGISAAIAAETDVLAAAGWQHHQVSPAAGLASCLTKAQRKMVNRALMYGGALGGLGCALAAIGAAGIWTGPPGATAAAVGGALCAFGIAILYGEASLEAGDVPDCDEKPPECEAAPAAGASSGNDGGNGNGDGDSTTTGMGSAPPPGGDGCGNSGGGNGGGGNGGGDGSSAAIPAQIGGQGDFSGRYVVRTFSSGSATPFTGVTDAGGYFYVPFIPAGEPFTAVAVDLVTGANRTFTGIGPATGDSVVMSFNFVATEEFVPTIFWDGGGDGSTWQDPLNWNLDRVPNESDRVSIESEAPLTVDYTTGHSTIVSLKSSADLNFAGGFGSLTVNAESEVSGELTLGNNFTLIAAGPGTTFTASGAANVNGANLTARAGGRLIFPTLTGYAGSTDQNTTTLLADGPGSVIDVSAVTNLQGNTRNFLLGGGAYLIVRAANGGRIDFGGVAEISEGRVQATAEGVGSQIDFSGLTRFAKPSNGESFLRVIDGGAILAEQLTEFDAAGLTIVGTGQISTTQIVSFVNAKIEVDNSSPDFSGLATVNGSDLIVRNGGVLSLPEIITYDSEGSGFFGLLRAEGVGSTLDLTSTVVLNGQTFTNDYLNIEALNGGVVDLRNLPAITVGKVRFTADGAGSRIELASMERFLRGGAGVSFLRAVNGGTIDAESLTILEGITLNLDGTGTLATSQMTRFSGGVAEVVGTTPDFSNLTEVDGSDFLVTGGGTVTLPQVTSYGGGGLVAPGVLRAQGTGSTLELSALTSFEGRTFTNSRLDVEALAGGTILLNNVSEITVGMVQFTADGTGSGIDLSALTRFERGNNGVSWLKPRNNGTIILNGGTTAVQRVLVELAGTGTLAVGTLALETGSSLAGTGTLPGNLVNDGRVAPGLSAGSITVGGTYAQAEAGVMAIELGGSLAGTGFDQVTVNGTATLTGTLDITLINSYVPNVGDSFVILTSNSIVGTFDDVTGLSIDSGKTFAVNYSGTEVILTVEAVP